MSFYCNFSITCYADLFSFIHSLIFLVTLFIFCITTFYITFIHTRKIRFRYDAMVCVSYFYINYLVYERWTSLFLFFSSLLLKVAASIEKNKTSYMLFHFLFLVEKIVSFSAHVYQEFVCLRRYVVKLKLQDMTRVVKKFYGLLF